MTGEGWAMAEAAAALWGATPGSARPVKVRENIVFQIAFPNGASAALRLHRPGYQTRATIEAELDWTTRLAAAGLRVPRPRPTLAGATTARVGSRQASVVGWLEGAPAGDGGRPLSGTRAEQTALFAALGGFLGDLHRLTDGLEFRDPPVRQHWNVDGFLGESPLWGRFWENPTLTPAEQNLLLTARKAAAAQLLALIADGADCGLIHADVLRENILLTPAGLALIDFDDCGYGPRLYDLGTALVQNLEEPHLPELAAALASGYASTRPAPGLALPGLVLFVALRAFASAGWIISRAAPDDPRQRFYAERALVMARHIIDGTAPWGRIASSPPRKQS